MTAARSGDTTGTETGKSPCEKIHAEGFRRARFEAQKSTAHRRDQFARDLHVDLEYAQSRGPALIIDHNGMYHAAHQGRLLT
jgi:hypothetical protein